MKLFSISQRFCSYFLQSPLFPSVESQILHLFSEGSLSAALNLLNTTRSDEGLKRPYFYASLLQTCNNLLSFRHSLQIHCHVVKSGMENDRIVGNSLLSVYFKSNANFSDTRRVFDGLHVKDVISWTSIISEYVKVGKPWDSIELFWKMLGADVEPNAFTLSSVIKACSEVGDGKLGARFHGMVMAWGMRSNPVICSALIDMYGRTSQVDSARMLFNELVDPDEICWTSLISGLTRNDLFEEALNWFIKMVKIFECSPDGFTLGTVLKACGNLGRLNRGKELHARVITSGVSGNVVVGSSLVDMYGKCGSVNDAWNMFDRMPVKNSVSWSALLGCYCQNGDHESVIRLFRVMDKCDMYSFGTVLRACGGLAALRQGMEVHCQYIRQGSWRDVIVESALVDLYAKCGCIDFARRVFKMMLVRNLIAWNAMICGLAQNGRGMDALEMFNAMMTEGVNPDYISFVGVLFACSHTGLVREGREHFTSMVEVYKIKPGVEHYNCMVNLLGRFGKLEEAEDLIEKSNLKDDSSLWLVLLAACANFMDSDTSERIAKRAMQLEPNCHLSYVLLYNMYRAVGKWSDASTIRRLMDERGIRKLTGRSWVDAKSSMVPRYHFDHLKHLRLRKGDSLGFMLYTCAMIAANSLLAYAFWLIRLYGASVEDFRSLKAYVIASWFTDASQSGFHTVTFNFGLSFVSASHYLGWVILNDQMLV